MVRELYAIPFVDVKFNDLGLLLIEDIGQDIAIVRLDIFGFRLGLWDRFGFWVRCWTIYDLKPWALVIDIDHQSLGILFGNVVNGIIRREPDRLAVLESDGHATLRSY